MTTAVSNPSQNFSLSSLSLQADNTQDSDVYLVADDICKKVFAGVVMGTIIATSFFAYTFIPLSVVSLAAYTLGIVSNMNFLFVSFKVLAFAGALFGGVSGYVTTQHYEQSHQ